MREALLIGSIVAICTVSGAAQRAPARAAAPSLPPLSMTCTTHPEVVEGRPGSCPICKMALVPIRLDAAWMCPVHTTAMEGNAGTCRVCGRDLIRVTVALTWTCRADATEHLDPGLCANGSPRVGKRTLRPHGNHNPRHGGQFFMAPDNWHHLEGTYPASRVFRLYVYDDYARALPPAELRRIVGRVVTEETYDPATRQTTDVRSFPLRASRDGSYLEARVDEAALPREMTAKIALESGGPEHRFDFTFTKPTREPSAPSRAGDGTAATAAAASAGRTASAAAAGAPDTSPRPSPEPGVTVDEALAVRPVPDSMDEMLRQMRERLRHVDELIARGNFEAVYVPAFHAKDIAVALEPHLAHLAPEQRDAAGPALERVVRTAWLLDAFGDVGNRQQLVAARAAFADAVAEVLAAFGASR